MDGMVGLLCRSALSTSLVAIYNAVGFSNGYPANHFVLSLITNPLSANRWDEVSSQLETALQITPQKEPLRP